MKLLGLHHITAIAADPKRNVDFYTACSGALREEVGEPGRPRHLPSLLRRQHGSPGSALTFFPWMGIRRAGRVRASLRDGIFHRGGSLAFGASGWRG